MRSDLENGTTLSSTACPPSAEAFQNAPDLASPCRASNENSCFKENININKSETPKLSLEPQQMKRKKKGGGYNLRKSLAWDRAFFTEEGILDPLELSTISDVSCTEDDDFGKDRKQDWSSPKLDSSSSHLMKSTSLTSHKFPTHLGGKPGSRFGDCPRPLPSPSKLKRPANVNVGKAAGKELKLPKVHGLNPGFTPTCATTRSTILRTNRVKHNQIIQPDFGIQRHAEPRSSSKSLKNIQNASTAITLQSGRHSDVNSGNSSLRRYSSISMSTPMVDKARNSASKMISDNVTTIRPVVSSEGHRYDSTTFEAPIPQSAHVGGKTMHPMQNIMAKPTGLRIPSPSLSFFSQPKPLVYRDLPQRNTETDGFGPQKPGILRLQDNLRMRKLYRTPESTISSTKVVSSKSECIVPSHASAVELIKPTSEHNPMHKIRDLPNKNTIARISHEAELQKIGIEVPSRIASFEPTAEVLMKGVDGDPESSDSGGSEWTNAEFGSKQNYVIQESEKISAINAPPKEKGTHMYLVLDHGSSQCADALDDRVQNTLTMQSDLRKNSKPDCFEPHKVNTDPLNNSLLETDKRIDEDKNVLDKKDKAREQLGVSKQDGSYCSGSIKGLEQRQIKMENPYFRSSHQYADPLKLSDSVEVLTDNLPLGEAHMQNSVFAPTIEGCKNDIHLMPEADDVKQPRSSSEVQAICHKDEMELEKCLQSNTSDRLSPEKPISCQNSQQIENVEKLLLLVQDRKDRDKVIASKMPISLSPGRGHDSYLGKETIIVEPLTSTVSDYINDLVSSESSTSLINAVLDCNDKHQGNANALLNGTTHKSHFPHQDTQRTDLGNFCPLPESRNDQLSQKDTLGKEAEDMPCIENGSAENWLISTMPLGDSESDINNLRDLCDTGTMLVQSPESNMLSGCFPEQLDCMAQPSDRFVADNHVHPNNQLQAEGPADVTSNALGSSEDSVEGQDEMYLSTSKSPNLSAKESPSRNKSCNGPLDHSADAITDPSRVKPCSDTVKDEVSDNTTSSLNCLPPKLDHVMVEAASAPNNKHQNVLNEKSRSLVIPHNAVPFSDEWLAAIEAAGEDILTRKSGKVQNSPPDKSVPEPSPWSPVKRKNNQIGPFDCTKFSAPSDSTST